MKSDEFESLSIKNYIHIHIIQKSKFFVNSYATDNYVSNVVKLEEKCQEVFYKQFLTCEYLGRLNPIFFN